MKLSKKSNQWFFGMEGHIGADAESGLVHSVRGSADSVNDVVEANSLLHGREDEARGDAGCHGADMRPDADPVVRWNVALRPGKRRRLGQSHPVEQPTDQLARTCARRQMVPGRKGPCWPRLRESNALTHLQLLP